MTTPEDQLEASIWLAMSDCKVTCPEPLKFIEAMTFAAQRYAAGDSPIVTALRRSVLHRDASPEGQTSPSSAGESAERRPSFHPPGSAPSRRMWRTEEQHGPQRHLFPAI